MPRPKKVQTEITDMPEEAAKETAVKEPAVTEEPEKAKIETKTKAKPREDIAAVRAVLANAGVCKYPTLVDYPSVGSLREYRLYNIEYVTLNLAWKAYREANPLGSYLHFFDILDSELGEVPDLFKIVTKMSL